MVLSKNCATTVLTGSWNANAQIWEKWRLEQERDKGAKDKSIDLAKKLLALNNMSAEEIRKLTGLTIREINKVLKEI